MCLQSELSDKNDHILALEDQMETMEHKLLNEIKVLRRKFSTQKVLLEMS